MAKGMIRLIIVPMFSYVFIYACYKNIYIYIYNTFSIPLANYSHSIVCYLYGLLLHGPSSSTICVQNGEGLCCKLILSIFF